jgi:hypothetical protein
VRNFLFFIVVLLTIAHLIHKLAIPVLGHGFPLFDLDGEANFPSFFSANLLFFAAILLGLIAFVHKKMKKAYVAHWFFLSLIFLFLSLDEFTEIHERINFWLKPVTHTTGLLYAVWIIPYGIFALVLLFSYLKFLMNLPRKTAVRSVVAGAIYVTGALVMEALGERLSEKRLEDTFAFNASVVIEEVMEMIGSILFIYALLSYIATEFEDLHIRIT